MKIRTKIIGSVAGQSKALDESINEWIDSQDNIEIIDIKFQTVIGQTSSSELTVVANVLIIYKEFQKNAK